MGPFGICVAGGQKARQSVVPDRLKGNMFSNRILFLSAAWIQRFPLCHMYFLMIQVVLEANKHFSEVSRETAFSFVQKEYNNGDADYFMCFS